ncbi:MAG: hypothetical protein U9N62_11205 [Thermotogota bacterium]|nr:hypothetical protein [Thermotogota bacterium]
MKNTKGESMKFISEKDQEKLFKMFEDGAQGIKVALLPEHWAHGGDEGLSYCLKCCKKEVAQLRKEDPENKDDYYVDGGWGTEGDSIAFCETCEALLDNSLTDYGSEEEVRHFLEHGFDVNNEYDCYSMTRVICGHGWRPWDDKESDLNFYEDLHKLCKRILGTIANPGKRCS